MTTKHRQLIKGHLQPPIQPPFPKSYTQTPPSADEIIVKRQKQKVMDEVVEFSSTAIPLPFLDPSIIKRRIELANQGKRA